MEFLKSLSLPVTLIVACVLTSGLRAQGGPEDYDLEIRFDSAEYGPGDTATATVGVVAREPGMQGWSFGASHDPAVLSLETAEQAADTVNARVEPSFEVTRIIEDENGTRIGFIQGVVLSFISPAEVPANPDALFGFAVATYTVLDFDCPGDPSETAVEITETLAAPGSPPVDINLTVDGRAIIPDTITNASALTVCSSGGDLSIELGPDDDPCIVVADGDPASTLGLEVSLVNGEGGSTVNAQGWSYAVAMTFDDIVAVEAAPGADAAALMGGEGPDFVHYNLEDSSEDGAVRGVTAGAVIALDAPGTEVLPIPSPGSVHIDTITVRAAVVLGGGETRETEVSFVDQVLGGDRPLEIIVVVDNDSVIPDFSDTKTVTLQGVVEDDARYIRGDANNDRRVDIADGVWIISMLFRGGEMTTCLPAANANADSNKDGSTKVDISDAMYIFNYRLQPGATPATLFPAPSAPFPSCAVDPNVDLAECPVGSHICSS